jgi:Gpi18-like mannosyltransferase
MTDTYDAPSNFADQSDVVPVSEEAVDNSTPLSPKIDSTELPYVVATKESSRLLHGYLTLVIIANFCLLFLKGYSADLGYWENWIGQLMANGYNNFNGNYPPFYVHWLYLLGKLYTFIGIPLEANNFLKFLTQLPVVLSHCLFTTIIFSLLTRFHSNRLLLHFVMMLTVLNPTILVNGPIWGQVDLLPVTLVVCALLLNFHARFSYFAVPMFMLALLTKFQMIAFAPVFGFLFFRNIKNNVIGLVLAAFVGAIIFMPSIIAGHFIQAFKQAYIDTLGQYPMTTFNAANMWILLTSNTAPDSQLLFGVPETSAFVKIFTAKYFGMLIFVVIALWVFLQGAYRTIRGPLIHSVREPMAQALFASMLCAMAFFTFLPAMHERYLFPAAVMALAYVAIAHKKFIYPIAISLLCGLNMFIILEVNGSDIWSGLSWLMVVIMSLGLLEAVLGETFFTRLKRIGQVMYRIPKLSVWFFVVACSIMFFAFYGKYQVQTLVLTENKILLTSLTQLSATQDHGSLKYNKSYDGNKLAINGRRYEQGLGTHSNSTIQYQLPDNAREFSFIAGLDDEVGLADVQFSVLGDDKLLWQSKIFTGVSRDAEIKTLDVRGVKVLTLKVAALKDDKWDHADWVNTVITLSSDK